MHPESLEVVLKNVRGRLLNTNFKKVYRNSIRLFEKKHIKLLTRTPKRVNNPWTRKSDYYSLTATEGFRWLYVRAAKADFLSRH